MSSHNNRREIISKNIYNYGIVEDQTISLHTNGIGTFYTIKYNNITHKMCVENLNF